MKNVFARRHANKEWHYLMMLAPLLIFVLAIALYPLLFSFYISFFKYRLTDPDQLQTFVGLANYFKAFQDPAVIKALSNTLIFDKFHLNYFK